MENRSPWIAHLGRTRALHAIKSDHATDIAIVGAGIAGVATAHFILTHTPFDVILVDSGKVAHGATGHNAGQLLTYFEKSFAEMVREFGLELAAHAVQSMEGAWSLMDRMIKEYDLQTPLYRFTGYAGIASEERILEHLNDNAWRKKAGIALEAMTIASDASIAAKIPTHYRGLYRMAPQADLLGKLQTTDPQYLALLTSERGIMNSARFTEEVVTAMLKKFSERLTLSEDTPVRNITLSRDEIRLTTSRGIITAAQTILCTNGFEYVKIENLHGAPIDTKFHHTVNGVIGEEPCNTRLLYNVGCNGIGLLPSIFGGSRIAKLVAGEELPPSIFDPRDQRCELPTPHQHHKTTKMA